MVVQTVEVIDRFEDEIPCQGLVYSPVPDDCTARETRIYEIDAEGSEEAVQNFIEDVLVDDVSQEVVVIDGDHDSAFHEYEHRLDVWLKDDVLNLEEDYLADYCRNHTVETGFELNSIRILERYYFSLSDNDEDLIETIINDLTNPVIHQWAVANSA
jgi:phosphoribosylformylglycinamidine (FGAM) synthase PurS component